MKLTHIDFDTENYAFSKIGAQQIFLRTVKKIMPEVLDDLNKEPFNLFREAYGVPTEYYRRKQGEELSYEENKYAEAWWRLIPVVGEEIFSDDPKEFVLFKESLWNWSKKWNLDVDWCRVRAYYTIAIWLLESEKRKDLDWYYDNPIFAVPFEIEEFTFKWAWHPTRSKRIEIERIMRKLFEKDMKEYLDRTERRFLKEYNARPALTKKQEEHFTWLVLFHLKEIPYKDIFDRYKGNFNLESVKAVRKAINETAHLIDLPLRQNGRQPGRPAKISR